MIVETNATQSANEFFVEITNQLEFNKHFKIRMQTAFTFTN